MTMGLTAAQARCLDAVIHHVELHGVTPSFGALANSLDCNKSNVQRYVTALIERGHLERAAGGGIALPLSLPPYLARRLAGFCRARGENIPSVMHDAISLHLDALAGAAPELEAAE